jgi:transposase
MSEEEKDQKIEKLARENAVLREKIAELERRLGINSETSSKPPSSDGLKAKKRTKSLRERGKRASGGQKGHLGQTLEKVEKADDIIEYYPVCQCGVCGHDISRVEAKEIFKRQVFDIPEPRQMVTEHRVIVKECPECKTELKGSFPSSVKAPVQ